jgi:hypothetical protein
MSLIDAREVGSAQEQARRAATAGGSRARPVEGESASNSGLMPTNSITCAPFFNAKSHISAGVYCCGQLATSRSEAALRSARRTDPRIVCRSSAIETERSEADRHGPRARSVTS